MTHKLKYAVAIKELEKAISNNEFSLIQHRECLTASKLCSKCQFLMNVNNGLRIEISLLSTVKVC